MSSKNGLISHKTVVVVFILVTLAIIYLAYYKYLVDPYSVFDDQRNILKSIKIYRNFSFDYMFYSGSLYFLLCICLDKILLNVLVLKVLFVIIVPFFIVYAYNIIRINDEKTKSCKFYMPVMFTVLLLLSNLQMPIYGSLKSIAFPLLLGVVYFTIAEKNILALLLLFFMAFIYPPLFIVGLMFFILFHLYQIFIQIRAKQIGFKFNEMVRLNATKMLSLSLILIAIYSGYYVAFIYKQIEKTEVSSVVFSDSLDIDKDIKREIERTRTDFIPSLGKYFGIIPRDYLSDKRMGMFGMTGGIKPWMFYTFILLAMLVIRKNKFHIPRFITILFVSSIFLYFLAHVFYNKLYFPSRYTWFTFPVIAIYLIVMNLSPSIQKLTHDLNAINKKYKFGLIIISISLALLIFYLSPLKKFIYFCSRYTSFDFLIFIMVVVSLSIFSGFLMRNFDHRIQKLRKYNYGLSISIFFVVTLVIFNISMDRKSEPVNIYDKDLFPVINKLGNDISLCGYPEMMDNINALVPNRLKVNLGQQRSHKDAYEFYHLLTAYYSRNLKYVYKYMSAKNYDFLVIQKDYFQSNLSEENSLFSFYPILRSYERRLKNENSNKFAMLNPPREIIEFESQRSILVSYYKLKNYLFGAHCP